jgi:hypothetical protein
MVATSCRKTGLTQQNWQNIWNYATNMGISSTKKENRSKIVKIHGPGNLRCYTSDVDLNRPILSPSWPRGFCRFLKFMRV